MPYTLITVTNAGEVKHSRGFETLEMCEQAKSIALTGMTIEENKAADEAYAKRQREKEAKWRAAHPPRVPTDEERARWAGTLFQTGHYCTIGEDGLLYEWYGETWIGPSYRPQDGESVEFIRGGHVLKHRHDIKYAKCVIEPEGSSA